MADSAEEFLSLTATVPADFAETPQAPPPPDGFTGVMADPMKPWQSIDVEAYVPVVKWAVKKAWNTGGKFAFQEERQRDLWNLDDEELDSIDPQTKEAVQRCMYDLRLSQVAGNPYVAFIVALATLGGAKYLSIQLLEKLRQMEEAKKDSRQSEPGKSYPISPVFTIRNEEVSPPPTPAASSTANGKTRGSGAVRSSADSQGPASPNTSSTEFEGDDE